MPFNPQSILLDSRFASRVESRHVEWFNARNGASDELSILADGSVCESDSAGSCEGCYDLILLDDLTEVICPRRNGASRRPRLPWCAPCVRNSAFECADCNETLHEDLSGGENSGGDRVCDGCADHYFTCENCNGVFCNDDYGSDGNCRECDKKSAIIKPYTFKQYDGPIGKGPLFFGVELEVECTGDRDSIADTVADQLEDFAVLKEDGSLSDGFEIVTRPASLECQRDGWKPFFDDRPEGLKSFNTKTCGLHVHASRAAMTPLQISKVVCFVNSPENQAFVEKIAGRPSGEWARYHGKKLATAGNRTGQRYEAVNLENSKTIEFRIFKGTLKETSFWRCIEFCDALIAFCAPAGRTMGESLDWRAFARFVREGRKAWPNLHTFVDQRILGNSPKQIPLRLKTATV